MIADLALSASIDDQARPPSFEASSSAETSLLKAMSMVAPQGVRTGCRIIRRGDEAHLFPEEARSIPARSPTVHRASGAARWIAHGLLADLGMADFAVLRTSSGTPAWPRGITGSLAHSDEMAVAAVALVSHFGSIGIDVEPARPLPKDVLALIRTCADVTDATDRQLAGSILFSAKEAVYKAVYPLDRKILDYQDIAVDLNSGLAATTTGHTAQFVYCIDSYLVVLAFVQTAAETEFLHNESWMPAGTQ
jgi:4'-phosphopantetheinyl transferase EntD